jgi:hypothetical protein
MTQEALSPELAPHSPLGGHAAALALRVRLDNEGAFRQIGTSVTADCLNAVFGAVLVAIAHGPGFNFWTGVFDDAHPTPANMNPGFTNTAEAEPMCRAHIAAADLLANGIPDFHNAASTDAGDLDALADWSSIQAQANYHAGNDIFMI